MTAYEDMKREVYVKIEDDPNIVLAIHDRVLQRRMDQLRDRDYMMWARFFSYLAARAMGGVEVVNLPVEANLRFMSPEGNWYVVGVEMWESAGVPRERLGEARQIQLVILTEDDMLLQEEGSWAPWEARIPELPAVIDYGDAGDGPDQQGYLHLAEDMLSILKAMGVE